MCQYVESIRIYNNQAENLSYHNARLNRTRRECFGCSDELQLEEYLQIPGDLNPAAVYKCRVLYKESFVAQEFHAYTPRDVKSLKVVETSGYYAFKSVDRSLLDELMTKRGECDNILIVKDGFITDTAYSNVALFNGEEWITPDTYLLPGTARQRLLDDGVLRAQSVRIDDLSSFKSLKMINAMLPFEKTPTISIENIVL